jgi:hypothetical protein
VEDSGKFPNSISPFVRIDPISGAFSEKKGLVARFQGQGLAFLTWMEQKKLSHFPIEVWDAQGLYLLGHIEVDLCLLLRQGKAAVQLTREFDLISPVFFFFLLWLTLSSIP